MESSKEEKECQQFGHLGPLRTGQYSLVCDHCHGLLMGSLLMTVAELVSKLAAQKGI